MITQQGLKKDNDLYEDELSLSDIWRTLVKRKNTIFLVTFLSVVCAIVYALTATPLYKTKTTYLPPSIGDIQALNVQGISETNVGTVYNTFKKKLLARAPRQKAFKEVNFFEDLNPYNNFNDVDELEAFYDEINKDITISTPRNKKIRKWQKSKSVNPTVTLSLKGKDPAAIAKAVNRIAEEALRETKVEIISNFKAKLATQIESVKRQIQQLREVEKNQRADEIIRLEVASTLEQKSLEDQIRILRENAKALKADNISRLENADNIQGRVIQAKIDTLRSSEKVKRLDRLIVLREAAGIARSLKIKDAIGYKLQKINDSSLNSTQIITDISDDASQFYARGYEAIEAEISSLTHRKTDDPFIADLRGLQDQLKQLDNNEKITALKARQNDDPFIPELRGLQKKLEALKDNRHAEMLKNRDNDDPFIKSLRDLESKLASLNAIHIDPNMITVAHLVRAAYPPKRRIKPKRARIVIISLILGLMLGVFIAFFMTFLENERLEKI